MRYTNVCLDAITYTLPEESVTSEQIELWLEPLYLRLALPVGRLELITGIQRRRFWPPGTLPSGPSIASAEQAIRLSCIDRGEIGALVHGSVCRDHLEPATACRVHHGLDLPSDCLIYDVSNACLGLLNGIVQVANMIELGQIRAGLVVGTEGGRQLVETTIAALNRDTSITRESLKPALASLTIGSGSAAILLVHRGLSRTGNRLLGGVARAVTDHHELCHSGRDEAVAAGMQPLMQTDSEQLMHNGIAAGRDAYAALLAELDWPPDQVDKVFCHQVGAAHRKLMLQSLNLEPQRDYATVAHLGNTGSVALPITAALGIENNHLATGDHVALLGIGSGINVVMLGMQWQRSWASDQPSTVQQKSSAAESRPFASA